MIPFHLVTGFLGSGKTTLLKSILGQYAGRKRIAVIQNEFAASGTDGQELALTGSDFKLVEVNNGSVFCVCMLGTFSASLRNVIDTYQPEMIFLEASGLSDPINILELLQDPLISEEISLSHIFAIVDGVHFEHAVKMLSRTRHQVMVADTVVVNKVDLLTGEATDRVRSAVTAINPFATVIEASYCNLDLDQYILGARTFHQAAEAFGKKEGGGRPDVKAVVLRINRRITPGGLHAFVGALQSSCPRIKGYANTTDGKVLMIQSVFGTYEHQVAENYVGPTEIIAFGRNFTPRRLKETFLKYLEQ